MDLNRDSGSAGKVCGSDFYKPKASLNSKI